MNECKHPYIRIRANVEKEGYDEECLTCGERENSLVERFQFVREEHGAFTHETFYMNTSTRFGEGLTIYE